ncbi:MAG: hypothetical protein ACI4DY_12395 [Monoglobaceae bacterium]
MTEKFLRSIMIGVCVFLSVVIAAYVSFAYVYRRAEDRAARALLTVDTPAAAESSENPTAAGAAGSAAESYIARIDGDALAIYAVSDGREKFLYNLNVRIQDISESEQRLLKDGVTLADRQALASFEEDFTS